MYTDHRINPRAITKAPAMWRLRLDFGHIWFTVPDVAATVERLEEHGVKVVKHLSVASRAHLPISDWEIERSVGVGNDWGLAGLYNEICKTFAHVHDPVSSHQKDIY
jgi:catechol 2,3-dioxygenase-like lactoylglutathione lyase family enzyme